MTYEVEQKFVARHSAGLLRRCDDLGITFGPPVQQVDTYYRHPLRDFASTDEALRVRQVGSTCVLTYKGPKADTTTKTRREIEIGLADGAADQLDQMLSLLGFQRSRDVRKSRRTARLVRSGRPVEVALDVVHGLGEFVELEIIAGQRDVAEARACIEGLAAELQLTQCERRSYLELLLRSEEL